MQTSDIIKSLILKTVRDVKKHRGIARGEGVWGQTSLPRRGNFFNLEGFSEKINSKTKKFQTRPPRKISGYTPGMRIQEIQSWIMNATLRKRHDNFFKTEISH